VESRGVKGVKGVYVRLNCEEQIRSYFVVAQRYILILHCLSRQT
jgi:hypothetical protein